MKIFLFILSWFCLPIYCLFSQNIANMLALKETKIVFDNSAIEAIYLNPEGILQNIDSFWTYNKAFALTKDWHARNNVEIPYKKWKKSIAEIEKLSSQEAKNFIVYKNGQYIIAKSSLFNEKAVPHIFTFLPNSVYTIEANIFLLTGTVPYAFAYQGNIVLDLAMPKLENNPERILNILVHEVYHIGLNQVIAARTPENLKNNTIDYLYNFLLNEGIASYVAYTAQDIFPNYDFNDYKMFENENDVKKHVILVNSLFSKIKTKSDMEMRLLSQKIGVKKRAYYVTGLYMVQTIDRKLGRETLIKAIADGPKEFFRCYNSLVSEEFKIVELY